MLRQTFPIYSQISNYISQIFGQHIVLCIIPLKLFFQINIYKKLYSFTMNPNFNLLIDCYKIITWLDERKKLVKDWQTYLKATEAQITLMIEN
jgi:hypothetical protein